MELFKSSPNVSMRQAIVITTSSNQSSNINQRNSSKQTNNYNAATLHNKSRGLSLGNNLSPYLREYSEEKSIKSKKRPLFQSINAFSISHNSLIQENEIFKLQIAVLKKENSDLKKQNALYYQHLIKKNKNSNIDTDSGEKRLSNTIDQDNSNYGFRKTIIGSLFDNDVLIIKNNESPLVEKQFNTPQSGNKPIISFNTDHNKNVYCLKKKIELNQSIDALTSFNRSTNKSCNTLSQMKKTNTNANANSNLTIQLNTIKIRTETLIKAYKQKFDDKRFAVTLSANNKP